MVLNDAIKEIEVCRKVLAKAKPQDLGDGKLIAQAINLALRPCPTNSHLKLLELILNLLRQLNHIFAEPHPSSNLADLVQDDFIPAFAPGQIIAQIITVNVEHPQKVQQTRAVEILSAAGKLSTLISSQTSSATSSSSTDVATQSFVVPFFKQSITSGLSRRSNLAAISALVDYVPRASIPDSLVHDLLRDLAIVDSANLRCTLIVKLLILLEPPNTAIAGPDDSSSVLAPLIPYFDPAAHPHAVLNNLNRYLLPALFKAKSELVITLLDVLSGRPHLFAAWTTVASIGVSMDLIKIDDLPPQELHDALANEDVDVRLRAFELVSGPNAQLSAEVLELVKDGYRWNDGLPNAGSRSTFSASTYAFLTRLQHLETLTRRIHRKKLTPTVEAERTSVQHIIPLSTEFRAWFLTHLDRGLRQARRSPVFRALLALNLLDRYLEVFRDEVETQEKVFTEERVDMLFACQMSEFTEVRTRARKILESATIPLPGYETMSTPKAQTLLSSALSSLNLPRRTQAEAGKSALCILFGKLSRDPQEQQRDEALEFVIDLVNRLEKGVAVVEMDLVKGIEEYPLHGSLAAIGDLLLCLDLSSSESQRSWQPTLHRLFGITNRIWGITRPVISLAPSRVEGALASDSAGPEHEIARAYEVMGGEDGEGDDEESMDHTGLLSGCWRATRNAGELLATIISLPITQAGASQVVWTTAQVDQAGQFFLTWMHEIRHRGTFSKIASAFAQFVEAVQPIPDFKALCKGWLQHELTAISSDTHSTTRRSAALPYSILSLVSSDPSLIDTALTSLLDLARVDNAQTSNVTKVHAFNVLKIVLLDTRQGKVFSLWFERGVMTALGAFESPDWNVRNVGLIFFSTMVHRCLSPPRGGQDYYRSRSALATRSSFAAFHAKYPKIIPFITEYLRQHSANTDRNKQGNVNRHSPLFPILIIVRSLRWSVDEAELQNDLKKAVAPYLNSEEFQVRQVAAQALASLVSSSEALQQLTEMSGQIPQLSLNSTHGHLLFLRQLISNVILWSDIPPRSQQDVENGLIKTVERYIPGDCPPVTQAASGCVEDYLEHTSPVSGTLLESTVQRTEQYLSAEPKQYVPAEESRRTACTRLLLNHSPSSDLMLKLLSSGAVEDDHLLALEHLPSLSNLWSQQTFQKVLALALTGSEGHGVQTLALDILAEISWPTETVDSMRGRWKGVVRLLTALVEEEKCVPVNEAALTTLGWAVNQLVLHNLQPGDKIGRTELDSAAGAILVASDENQSQPTRFAALQSLRHLTSYIFALASPHPILIRSLLRSVQDDDEEIRLGACEIVSSGLGKRRVYAQAKSLSLVWEFVTDYLNEHKGDRKDEWFGWIEELARDQAGTEYDLKLLKRDRNNDVLFSVEAPNIFRDPLIDVYHASKLLNSLGHSISSSTGVIDGSDRVEEGLLSPIDDAWEGQRTMKRRMEYQRGPGL
ncbi:hypothetical protein I317_00139 [Kwoniella heveanensis CBS 569]|nr:hypothetical protein I317_00139 [Kwoniella heveanensis CBS 569]